MYQFFGYANLPYNDADWNELGKNSSLAINIYPVDPAVVQDLSPFHWAQEAFKIDQEFVYDGVVENKAVSEDYKTEGTQIAYKQIVIAGHRLANLLRSLKWPILRNDEKPVTMKEELIEVFQNFLV